MGSSDSLDRLVRIFSLVVPSVVAGCETAIIDAAPSRDSFAELDPSAHIDTSQFSADLCVGEARLLARLRPSQDVDYVELRESSFDDSAFAQDATWEGPDILGSAGMRCAGSSDPQACEQALAALPLDSEFEYSVVTYLFAKTLAYTRGDEVGVVRSMAGLRQFLGPIDRLEEAALVAELAGHVLVCGAGNNVGWRDNGYVLWTTHGEGCGGDDVEHRVVRVGADGVVETIQTEFYREADPDCSVGRLPGGLCRTAIRGGAQIPAVGAFFARVAYLEAAAVAAFAELRTELIAHAAPRRLVAAAERARVDEIRHARLTSALARRFGAVPRQPRVKPIGVRSLVEIARDNAAEGCVRETFGAAIAHVQARKAQNPSVRRVLAGIARDETRHAALSWDLARWLEGRLTAPERTRVRQAMGAAVARATQDLGRVEAEAVQVVAGMPDAAQAARLVEQLVPALYG